MDLSVVIITAGISWHKNNDDGTWGAKISVHTGGSNYRKTRLHDVNCDGHLDVCYCDMNENKISWHQSSGDGTDSCISTTATLIGAVSHATDFRFADFDGDGDDDVAFITFSPNKIGCVGNTTPNGGTLTCGSVVNIADMGTKGWEVSVADMQGDGLLDVSGCNNAGTTIKWYANMWDGATFGFSATVTDVAADAGGPHGAMA